MVAINTKLDIDREYYPITEASKKLGCSVLDLVHLGVKNELRLFLLLSNNRLELNISQNEEHGLVKCGNKYLIFSDLALVRPSDLCSVEFEGNRQLTLTSFYSLLNEPEDITQYIKRATNSCRFEFHITYDLNEDLIFYLDDLKVMREDIKKLQDKDIQSELVEKIDKPLGERERNSLYRIIAALSETILKENSDDENKQHLKNQTSLIQYLDHQYDGYEGLSRANLEKILPLAKQLIKS